MIDQHLLACRCRFAFELGRTLTSQRNIDREHFNAVYTELTHKRHQASSNPRCCLYAVGQRYEQVN